MYSDLRKQVSEGLIFEFSFTFTHRRKNSLLESADGVPNPEPAILSVEVCFICGWNIDG
jgi:hypothetical protein